MQSEPGIDASKLLPIRAGEVHYARIPVEYWQHRILMIKALGLNALSIYIMWNYHQITRGEFDFKTGNKNLPLFLQLAQRHGMMVLFRPGPYVCAEWDFGGFPARLLNTNGIELRSNNPVFLLETKIYFQALVPIIRKHMKTESNKSGCIVMLQIENEYGFYGTDKSYIQQLRKIWADLDINLTEYYVDWIDNIQKCHWEGANIGINNFHNLTQEERVRMFEKKGFLLGGEIYSGWMTHWTEKWGGKSISKVLKDYEFLLNHSHSFAIYMVHGGTNFGLTAGANGLNHGESDYWADITSYDYDAPINQQGAPTPKYHAIRQFLKKYIHQPFTQIPEPIRLIQIPGIKLLQKTNLFTNFPEQKVASSKPLVFESDQLKMYNQGMVRYETRLPDEGDIKLKIIVHDYAQVYLNGHFIAVLDRTRSKQHTLLISHNDIKEKGRDIQILVQATGHINFDKSMTTDFKGLISIEGLPTNNQWFMSKLSIESWNLSQISKWKSVEILENLQKDTEPVIYRGSFILQEIGDTYLDFAQWGKGYVWINGHNLGRYWEVGPQKRLYCPGVWLKKGENQIVILNLFGSGGSSIRGVKELYDTPIQYTDDDQK